MPIVAVPVAAAIIVAIMAILLLYSFEQLAKAINQVMPSWHIPGLGSIRDWIENAITGAVGAVGRYAVNYIHPYLQMILAPIIVAKTWIKEAAQIIEVTYRVCSNIVTVTIPRLYKQLVGEIVGRFYYLVGMLYTIRDQIQTWTMHQIHAARAFAAGLVLGAEAKAQALFNAAIATVHQVYDYATGYAHTLYAMALTYASQKVLALEASLTAMIGQLRADTVSLFMQARADLLSQVAALRVWTKALVTAETTAIVTGLNGALITDIQYPLSQVVELTDELEKVAAGAFTDVIGDIRGLTNAMPRDLAGAIATTFALSIPLLKLARDCTVPNCRNLSQVGRDLQALFGLVEDGALLALLAAVAADPEAAASEARQLFVSPMTSLANEFADMIGVR
jgi:hypothetical protein